MKQVAIMETTSTLWGVLAAVWAGLLAAAVYLKGFPEPVWILPALWFVPMVTVGSLITWTICEKKGWV